MSKLTGDHLKDYEDYLRINNFTPPKVQSYLHGLR
jgi:hypothetical protein